MIGKRCRHVPRARAHEVIAGYIIVRRRERARLAASLADDDAREILRYSWADRAMDRHAR